MSTTRSQKRRNNQQEGTESVSEGLISPIVVENPCFLDEDVRIACGSFKTKISQDRKQPPGKFKSFFERGDNLKN